MERFRRLGLHEDAHKNGVWCVSSCTKTSGCDFATGGADGVIHLWVLKSGAETAAEALSAGNCGAGDANGAGDNAANVVTPSAGAKNALSPISHVASMKHHSLGIVGIAVASDATVGASTSLDGTLKLWDTSKPDEAARSVTAMSSNITEVWAVGISTDGSRVVTAGSGGVIQVVDVGAALCENAFNYDPDATTGDVTMCMSLALSPDNARVAVGAQDGSVRVFDVESGAAMGKKMAGHSGPVRSVAFVPGESSIVTCADDALINYYDVDAAQLAITLRGHAGIVLTAAPSPCGKYVATGSSDRKLKVWDRKLREQVFTTREHSNSVWDIAYLANGTRIVSVGDDGCISVIDCEHADTVTA
jgi:WD repeat-containing protein 61